MPSVWLCRVGLSGWGVVLKTLLLFASLAIALVLPGRALALDQAPSQEFMDNPPADSSMSGGSWADMDGGVAARPFIKSLTVVNGSESTPVFSGGVHAASDVAIGDVTGVVSPINLCKRDQPVQAGMCDRTPNRVGITLGYRTEQGLGTDFSRPLVALREPVGPDTVFDVVIGLNTLGRTLRWTWINGELVNWKTDGLGHDAAEIHLQLKPAVTPDIDWSQVSGGGCTATPIFDCNIAQASGSYLGASAVLSLDETLDRSLTGAAFATQGAISGYLVPSGTASDPALDLQMASSHLASDGSPQHGTLQAFLPAAALISTYGLLPADAASFFTATRRGDPGTQDPPQFDALAASASSDTGLLVTVRNVTFSAPTYRLARKRSPVRVSASTDRGATLLSTGRVAACRRRACRLVVYRTKSELSGRTARVATGRSSASGTSVATVPAARLPRGSSYIVVLRRGAKLLATNGGVVGRSRPRRS
jgi:hypothetical protein